MKSDQEIIQLGNSIIGFLLEEEMIYLYRRAYSLITGGCVVEIGSFKGKSTVLIATALADAGNDKAEFHAIDPFFGSSDRGTGSSEHGESGTFPEFQENLALNGIKDHVHVHRQTSMEAFSEWSPSNLIDFLWIDGAHEYAYISEDIENWTRYLREDGLIACHDSGGNSIYGDFSGVRIAVQRHLFNAPNFNRFEFCRTITGARKTHSFNPEDRFENWQNYLLWWSGETTCGIYKFSLKTLLRIIRRALKNIPKQLRKPGTSIQRK